MQNTTTVIEIEGKHEECQNDQNCECSQWAKQAYLDGVSFIEPMAECKKSCRWAGCKLNIGTGFMERETK